MDIDLKKLNIKSTCGKVKNNKKKINKLKSYNLSDSLSQNVYNSDNVSKCYDGTISEL